MRLGSSGQQGRAQVTAQVTVDYYAVLSRAIEASKSNPGQLRSAIYELARVNMHRDILWQQPEISDVELRRHFLALEDAIRRIEAEHFDNQVFRPGEPVRQLEAPAMPSAAPPPVAEPPAAEQSQVFQPSRAADEPPIAAETRIIKEPRAAEQRPVIDVARIVEALDVEPLPQPDPPPQEVEVAPIAGQIDVGEPEAEPQPEAVGWQPEPFVHAVDLDAPYARFEPADGHEPPAETHGELVVLAPEPPMAMQSGPMLQVAPNIIVDYHPPSRDFAYPPEPPARRVWIGLGAFIQLTAAALLAVAIFAVMTGQLNIRWLGNKQQAAAVPPPAAPAPTPVAAAAPVVAAPAAPAPPPFPLPATYGVYALHNDRLFELDRLAIRVPDPRVPISPEIREPSRVVLPDGKVSFVVFRRELANGAPEKVQVRVVAKVAREMTFTDGKAATNTVENLWRVRNNAFDFKVAPLNDNRELIVIRSDADFVLPSGRYALVINGQGYDFSVAGAITSPLQCLERIEAVNGAMYSECRNPQVN